MLKMIALSCSPPGVLLPVNDKRLNAYLRTVVTDFQSVVFQIGSQSNTATALGTVDHLAEHKLLRGIPAFCPS